MNFPDFLIIGAMKAGTTTLFRDLAENPGIYFPLDKEPGHLRSDDVLSASGAAAYAALYGRAKPTQLLGDASTTYSKLPHIAGVPERARKLLGANTKVIYLIRDPVARALSHHHHLITTTGTTLDIDTAVRAEPGLVAYGRYWMQLEPWLDAFGTNNIHVQRFEEYIQCRRQTINTISAFLGVPPALEAVDPTVVHNKGDNTHVRLGPWRTLVYSRAYRQYLRPRLSLDTRQRIRSLLLPKSPPRPSPPSPATVDFLIDELQPQACKLAQFLGLPGCLWDFAAIRERYRA